MRLIVVLSAGLLSGCAGFHTWVVAHQVEIAEVALVAGAASQVEGVAINTQTLWQRLTELRKE